MLAAIHTAHAALDLHRLLWYKWLTAAACGSFVVSVVAGPAIRERLGKVAHRYPETD